MLCVTALWVTESTCDQRTTNACVPRPATFGLPASAGKLLQRNAVPPPFMKQFPPGPLLSMPVKFTISWSAGAGQVEPPSGESSSKRCSPLLQLYQATISSPAASNAGAVPLPQLWAGKLIWTFPRVHVRPPSSLMKSHITWPLR